MKAATLKDLYLELWLRTRNCGQLAWRTRTGEYIVVKDMTNEHLVNAIKMLENYYAKQQAKAQKDEDYEDQCYEALGSIGDMFI